jgi:hypothetical protein
MPKLNLTREQLGKFLPDHQSIRAFEQLFEQIDVTIPDVSDEVNNNAGIAIAAANAALAEVANIISQLQQVLNAPVPQPHIDPDDLAPRLEIGTIASQNAGAVAITGGSIDGVTFGATTPGAATFTSISYSGQLTSTVVTGTAPFVVASTTKVANLNVDLLDGADWASPAAIGSTTPAAGTFTALTTNGTANVNLGTDATNSGVNVRGSNSGSGGGAFVSLRNNGVAVLNIGNKSAINGGAYDATPYILGNATIEVGSAVKFASTTGFNNTTPIAKPTVTGSRGGNAALASLLTALANYGLVTDSSTA